MFSLRTATRQPAFIRQLTSRTTTITSIRFSSDYGSGEAKPNTPNNAVHKEHPGPPPPKVAQNGSEQKSQPQQQENGGGHKKGKDGAKPKILAENPPAKGEESEDVAKHNREMEQRADRPAEGVKNEDAEKDKVGKGYWSGAGGRDKDP